MGSTLAPQKVLKIISSEVEIQGEIPDTWERLNRKVTKLPRVRKPLSVTNWFVDEPRAGDSVWSTDRWKKRKNGGKSTGKRGTS